MIRKSYNILIRLCDSGSLVAISWAEGMGIEWSPMRWEFIYLYQSQSRFHVWENYGNCGGNFIILWVCSGFEWQRLRLFVCYFHCSTAPQHTMPCWKCVVNIVSFLPSIRAIVLWICLSLWVGILLSWLELSPFPPQFSVRPSKGKKQIILNIFHLFSHIRIFFLHSTHWLHCTLLRFISNYVWKCFSFNFCLLIHFPYMRWRIWNHSSYSLISSIDFRSDSGPATLRSTFIHFRDEKPKKKPAKLKNMKRGWIEKRKQKLLHTFRDDIEGKRIK